MAQERSAFEEATEEAAVSESQSVNAGSVVMQDPFSDAVRNNEYTFAQTLACHSGAVRSLAFQRGADMLMSGSIDFSNKMYTLNRSTGKYDFTKEVLHHEGFVMNIIPNTQGTGFFSAGKDQRIVLIDIEGNPTMEYMGHTGAVNSLSQCLPNELTSGSWDGTAKIWDVETGQCKHTLEGHSHAVSVLTLPNGVTITGSQDKKIRLWYNGRMEKEFLGHDDIVRGFCEVPQMNGFASISNDEVVKLWSMDGSHMMDFKGHNGFIFAVDCLDTGEIVTGGDDCTVKLWADGACKQTIQLPKTVWAVTHDSFGDIIVGTEDKKIRKFTRDTPRQDKDGPDFHEYEEECKAAAQGGEKVDMDKLPDFKKEIEGRVKGKSDGFVQIFKEDNVAFAYMWSDAENKWNKIGEVQNPGQAAQETGQGNAAGVGQTAQYAGDAIFAAGEYDKVIDVDLGDGMFRKLPVNNGANLSDVADKFCAREHLGKSYVTEIVQFLRANTLPYATREIDANQNAAQPSDSDLMNQFFKQNKPTCKKIPCTSSILFDVVKLDGCKKKILEFNAELNILEGQELIYFDSMIKVLSATQNYGRSEVTPQMIKVIDKLLTFPIDKAFPCMDLFRVYLLHPTSYEPFSGSDAGAPLIQAMMRCISQPQHPKALVMLTIRALNNLFKNQSSQHVALLNRNRLVEAVTMHLTHPDKGVRQAAITLLMNYSVEFLTKDDPEGRIQIMSALQTCLQQETDLQNLLRISITLGNVAHKSVEAKSLLGTLGLQWPNEAAWQAAANEPEVETNKQTVREIRDMLLS